jgi:hypothetical protein
MNLRTAVLTGLLALVACTAALATPSTLVWIPSTDIQPDKTFHLGIDNYFDATDGFRSPTDVGLTYGLLGGRAEVGVDYMGGQDNPILFNAKGLLTAETTELPAVALGLCYFGTEKGVTDTNMVYGLVAKTFGPARLTLGYAHGKEATLGVDPDMLLAGVDGYLTADKKWWGAVDYQSGDNALGAVSAGISYAFADNVSVIIGFDRYNDRSLDDTITTQVDINF